MANVNKVILIGNLTRDPEVRYTGTGTAVADLGIAVNRKFKQGEETREETTFVDVTLWARQAEIAGEYLKKGNPVYIEGRLQLDEWEDKQSGEKRRKLVVVGESLQLLGGKPNGESEAKGTAAKKGNGGKSGSSSKPKAAAPEEEEVPF